MAEEEDIDTETIQAQIDLSMSITNDLVSSWLKPSNKPKTPYNQALEAELKEHMRKPPRLGVGASIPESISVSSREMARLKGSLVGKGKKRSREEEGESSHKLSSDDEGESRAGAIRKKTIPNPFTMPTPKKKKSSQADDAMNGESGASVKPSGKPSSDTTDYTLLAPSRGIFSQHDASQNKKLMNADQGHRSRGSSPPLLATNLEELKGIVIPASMISI
ncbi:hypothetical protein J3R30DRAFT_3480517 [Lentinula aciculospora]|uniref:Uncharacterized protein n=1 Tax=Lentinula aciculospora TaxID=153920 RepID=A0A9W9DN45_9AGAR|nr:hypothetical protein J3R30DRAFT_3480517 [Lentinula aciculospora]